MHSSIIYGRMSTHKKYICSRLNEKIIELRFS